MTPRALYIGGWKCRGMVIIIIITIMMNIDDLGGLILRKLKEIELIATTRFEGLDPNCVMG